MSDYETTQEGNPETATGRTTQGKGFTPPSAAASALETKSYGAGAPKREDFPPGGAGDSAYSKATRAFIRLKAEGQNKALSSTTSTPGS